MSNLKKYLVFNIIVLSVILIYPGLNLSNADQATVFQSPRFNLYFGRETKGNTQLLTEKQIADFAFTSLEAAYEEYSKLFGKKPEKKVTIRFLSPTEFKKYTGAPAWTSAMYFNDEITIPLNPKKGINLSDLGRAIKHEYAHAVIAEISDGKCPAWLDEGIAQYFEGKVNPLLGPALRKWISENNAMPLTWLQNGFTLLNEDIVPAAYAQSLFSTKKIIHDVGFEGIAEYLKHLREGDPEYKSFEESFKIEETKFTTSLTNDMRSWANSKEYNP